MSVKIAIGKNLYLHRGDAGPSEFLLITAHGATKMSTFPVPNWTRLHFYAPRGNYLIMPQAKFQLGSMVEEEIDGGAISPNYSLSKYQGRHGSANETYDSLGAMIDRTRAAIAAGRPVMPPIPHGAPAQMVQNAEAGLRAQIAEYENLLPFDFLTIRNRGVFDGTDLNTALQELDDAGHRYPYIFCSFCRGKLIGSGTHTVRAY